MIQFQVTLTAVSVATSFLEPLYTTLEFSPLQLRTSKELILILVKISNRYTGSSKKNLAKFSDTCFVRADGLCINQQP